MEVLGLGLLPMTLIVAAASTAVYQLRVDHAGRPLRKVLDGSLAMFGAGRAAAYAALQNIPSGATEMEQLGIVLGLVAGTAVTAHGAQKVVTRVRRPPRQEPAPSGGVLDVRRKVGKKTRAPALLAASAPEFTFADRWVSTNLVDHSDPDKGRMVPPGHSYLWARIRDVRSYTTAVLRAANGNPIQVAQSHEHDEDENIETVRLALFAADGTRLAPGQYELTVQGDRGTGDAQRVTTDFWIV